MVVMFEWNDNLRTGISSIDAQHKMLFAIGAELHAAMSAGQSREKMHRILTRLLDYTGTHFAHEERLMQLHRYPDYSAHRAEHDALTRQVTQLYDEFHHGQISVSVRLLKFLENWLKHHIGESDKRYAPFLAASAVA
jgi:hemerythrin